MEGLGDFMELERLAGENADPAAITDDLWRIMAELGVSHQDEVTDGYDILMKKLREQLRAPEFCLASNKNLG